jgi:hypothetical protein
MARKGRQPLPDGRCRLCGDLVQEGQDLCRGGGGDQVHSACEGAWIDDIIRRGRDHPDWPGP